MANLSIRFKLLSAVIAVSVLAGLVLAYQVEKRTERVTQHMGEAALKSSLQAFQTLEDADRRMLEAALVILSSDQSLAAPIEKGDREALLTKLAPTFAKLRTLDITHLYFETPAEEGTVFLRAHDPATFGDKLTRLTYRTAAEQHKVAAGLELGKTAFALRVVAPYESGGKQLGFWELGKEIDEFINLIKRQTGNDAVILLDKSKLDAAAWGAMRAKSGLADDWAAHGDYVVAANSMADASLVDFPIAIGELPEAGRTFGQVERDGRMYVRGAFPIFDAGNRPMGAVYLVHDATLVVEEMNSLLLTSAITAGLIAVLLVTCVFVLFDILVERRLKTMTNDAMRILGGDYETTVHIGAEDEIGRFERLFEQFRVVFVDTIRELEKKSGK